MKNLDSQLRSEWAGPIQLTWDQQNQFLQLTAWRLEGGYRRPAATFVLRVDHLAQNPKRLLSLSTWPRQHGRSHRRKRVMYETAIPELVRG